MIGAEQYFAGLARRFGVAVEAFAEPGVLVIPSASRSGERTASHHHVGQRSVIWIDPGLEPLLSRLRSDATALTFEQFRDWAASNGAAHLGHGLEHLLADTYRSTPWAESLAVIDGHSATGTALVRTLLDDCSEDDLDEAEFDLDALDPYLVGWVEQGRLLALAGGRPEPVRPGCMDIGVLVHADARRSRKGRAVVAAAADEVLAAGQVPLYRCNDENIGSRRLCRSVGFELVLELDAVRWPPAS
jgi:hypothetical protein